MKFPYKKLLKPYIWEEIITKIYKTMIYIKNLPVISEILAGMFPCELYYDGNNDSKVSLYEEGKNDTENRLSDLKKYLNS